MSVTLHTTLGDLKLELYCDSVPRTCENFLALCASDYYLGTVFHRNIPGFMVQGGDPTNTGDGGESIYGKTFRDEVVPALRHNARGVVSMANSGPDTNGSQFFIVYAAQEHLDTKYTVFAHLIDGEETLSAMERASVDDSDRPLRDIVIEGVTIHANPMA
eukprot:c2196_g1_i1.p2 GENE.c2196_g1_i1~~c2196_g1_i1.p2  ORF type:complete len:160 (+),score=37.58 c2196_g1_i1:80-559(+)